MPSTFTAGYSFELQGVGENLNLWGLKLNAALTKIDLALAGSRTITLTGNYSLKSSDTSNDEADLEAYHGQLKFAGALSSAATVTLPSRELRLRVWNNTNKQLTFTTGAGSTVTLDPGDKTEVWCDGGNVHTTTFGGYDLKTYIATFSAQAGAVPGFAGHSGKYLFTDGETGFWKPISITDIDDYQTQIINAQIANAAAMAIVLGRRR